MFWYKLICYCFTKQKKKVNIGIFYNLKTNGFAIDYVIIFVFQKIRDFVVK